MLSLGETRVLALTDLEMLELMVTIAVGCGWTLGVPAGDISSSGAQLVSKAMNVRGIKK